MIYHRLRLKNYRGVEELEAVFSPTGITIVQGPNEAGKTSLTEAIGILFEYKAKATHKKVRDIKPVHRDAGAEIELEAESGPYRFTYRKRFHNVPLTELTVHAPTGENLTGGEAHDRANAILDETLDRALWQALTVAQGTSLTLPSLTGQTALMQALDAAAGADGSAHDDGAAKEVWSKVKEEYEKYYTPASGKEKQPLEESLSRQREAEKRADEYAAILGDLDDKITQAARLRRRREDVVRETADLEKELARLRVDAAERLRLDGLLAQAKLSFESARHERDRLRREGTARAKLRTAIDQTRKEAEAIRQERQQLAPAMANIAESLDRNRDAVNNLAAEERELTRLSLLHQADARHLQSRLHAELMRERKERVDQARGRALAAEEEIRRNRATAARLAAVHKAEREVLLREGKVAAAAPALEVEGLADCRVLIDGEETALQPGQTLPLTLTRKTDIAVPNLLRLTIRPGGTAENLAEELREAKQALADACEKAGVATPAEAATAHARRQEAEKTAAERERIEKENLRDLGYDELCRRLEHLEAEIRSYPKERPAEPSLPPDAAEAETVCDRVNAELGRLRERLSRAREELESARTGRDETSRREQELALRLGMREQDLLRAETELSEAGKALPDAELDRLAQAAETAAAQAAATATDLQTRLEEPGLATAGQRLAVAEQALSAVARESQAVETKLAALTAEIRLRGEEGLAEAAEQAAFEAEECRRARSALLRRAEAAKLLYHTLRAARDDARQAYLAPLRNRVEELGRLLFGATFSVGLDEELRLVTRTLAGVTVDFEQLSAGSREQLALIYRAACARIVSSHNGMPLLLDDALGFSDAERLRAMGLVLATAARDTQVIVFTCMPERYRHVGNATVVDLW